MAGQVQAFRDSGEMNSSSNPVLITGDGGYVVPRVTLDANSDRYTDPTAGNSTPGIRLPGDPGYVAPPAPPPRTGVVPQFINPQTGRGFGNLTDINTGQVVGYKTD